ncbi:class I SAM-dependent methyltransferase [Candidatus Pelagibacter sp.]|nr:class I SAM-dependent methyltransferase [Candidatus Pelagibacter sp.]
MEKIKYENAPIKSLINQDNHLRIMAEFIEEKKNPVILEFGVERGSSTRVFTWLAEQIDGNVYSIDINDCSQAASSKNWHFFQSDDLKVDNILEKFPEIKEHGVDMIYIDSYHENHHVQKLLNLWFKYVKKDGAIFIDDVDSYIFRNKKDIWNSIVYDLTDEAIKDFYYSNTQNIFYTRYYGENGLAKLLKYSNLFDEPNKISKLWNYNIFIKILYPYLRKISKIFK